MDGDTSGSLVRRYAEAYSSKRKGLRTERQQTAANLVECVLPPTPLRQWVLTFPFPGRPRLAHDGGLLGALVRIFVETLHALYAQRAAASGAPAAKAGAVTVVRRTSSDLQLSPHLHVVFLDGAYHEPQDGAELAWNALGHLSTSKIGFPSTFAHGTVRSLLNNFTGTGVR